MARPQKMTEALVKTFCDCMGKGMYQQDAAAQVGVVPSTIYRWMQRGRQALTDADDDGADVAEDLDRVPEGERAYAEFYLRAARAESDWIKSTLTLLQLHGMEDRPGDWRALQAVMQMKYPDTYGNRGKSTHEHTGAGGAPITFEVVQIVGEEPDGGDG